MICCITATRKAVLKSLAGFLLLLHVGSPTFSTWMVNNDPTLPSSGKFVRGLSIVSSKSNQSRSAALSSSLNALRPIIAWSKSVPLSSACQLGIMRAEFRLYKPGEFLLIVILLCLRSTFTSPFQTFVNCSCIWRRWSKHLESRIRTARTVFSSGR